MAAKSGLLGHPLDQQSSQCSEKWNHDVMCKAARRSSGYRRGYSRRRHERLMANSTRYLRRGFAVALAISMMLPVVALSAAEAGKPCATLGRFSKETVSRQGFRLECRKSSNGLIWVTRRITVVKPTILKLALTRQSEGGTSGIAFTTQPQVTVQDAKGNTRTGSSAMVTATISAGGTLTGTTTAFASMGVATFSNLGIAGIAGTAYTITYSSGVIATVSQSVIASIGAASGLTLIRSAVGNASGVAFSTQPIVSVVDAGGNLATSSSAVIAASVSAGGTLIGSTTATAASGIALFDDLGITGITGTTYTLTFYTLSYLPRFFTAATQDVTLTPGFSSRIIFSRLSVGTASGAPFAIQPQVTIQDANGNTVTSSSALITATISAGGVLMGTSTATAEIGVATFSNLGITGNAGTTYVVTYSSSGLSPASQSVTVSVGAATSLAIWTPAAGAVVNTNFTTQPVIAVLDNGGNHVTTSTASVTISISPGSLSGVSTVSAINGIATFSSLKTTTGTGTGTFTLTYSSPGLASITQSLTVT